MIFGCAGEIFDAQLVLDGNNEDAARLEEALCVAKERVHRVTALRREIFPRIFKHADECNDIKQRTWRNLVKGISDDGNIIQVTASCCCSASADETTFQRNNVAATFTEKPGDCAATRTDLKNEAPGAEKMTEWAEQAGALGAEVVERGPVSNMERQLGRDGT